MSTWKLTPSDRTKRTLTGTTDADPRADMLRAWREAAIEDPSERYTFTSDAGTEVMWSDEWPLTSSLAGFRDARWYETEPRDWSVPIARGLKDRPADWDNEPDAIYLNGDPIHDHEEWTVPHGQMSREQGLEALKGPQTGTRHVPDSVDTHLGDKWAASDGERNIQPWPKIKPFFGGTPEGLGSVYRDDIYRHITRHGHIPPLRDFGRKIWVDIDLSEMEARMIADADKPETLSSFDVERARTRGLFPFHKQDEQTND